MSPPVDNTMTVSYRPWERIEGPMPEEATFDLMKLRDIRKGGDIRVCDPWRSTWRIQVFEKRPYIWHISASSWLSPFNLFLNTQYEYSYYSITTGRLLVDDIGLERASCDELVEALRKHPDEANPHIAQHQRHNTQLWSAMFGGAVSILQELERDGTI